MASELYQSFGSQQTTPAQQNPRDVAMSLMKQQGIQIPQGIENNPSAILNHLMQSGRIPQGRLNMAQQMLSKLFRR
jgi:hypothetical protein